MKNLLLMLSLSLTTLSFANDRRNVEDRMLQKAQQLEQVLRRNSGFMKIGEMRQVNQLMRQAIRIARGQVNGPGNGGHNGPGNGGYNGPGNGGYNGPGHDGGHGPYSRMVLIQATIESTSFLIEASNLNEIKGACVAKAKSLNIGTLSDNIAVKLNDGPSVRKTTSGWWRSHNDVCDVITKTALDQGFKQGIHFSHYQYVLSATAEGKAFIAEGNTIAELEASCLRRIGPVSLVDDITVSLNGGPIKRQTTSGWWRNKEQVCSVAVTTAF